MSKSNDQSLWTVRLLSVWLGIAVVSCALVAVAMVSIFPLKEIRPFAVNFANKSDVVTTILPIDQTVGGFDALARSLAKDYVIMRHSYVDSYAEMKRRWGTPDGIIFLQSSPEVYRTFLGEATKISQAVQQNGLTIYVDVKSVSTIEPGKKYLVDGVMQSKDKVGRITFSQPFVSTLEVEFDAIDTQTSNRLINPTGFTVVRYENQEKQS